MPTPPSFGENGLDETFVRELIGKVNARTAGADQQLLLLLRALYTAELPEHLRNDARLAILNFRYSLREPGMDAMDRWTESGQLVFATCELLAGQHYPTDIFFGDKKAGLFHRQAAASRLSYWLADRFRFGFSEWLSPGSFARNAAALVMLVDHAKDGRLATRAAIILDLILLDAGLHSFEQTLACPSACGDVEDFIHPENSALVRVLTSAFAGSDEIGDLSAISSIFVTRIKYQVPEAITALGREKITGATFICQGLDTNQVKTALASHPDYPRSSKREITRFWWGMHALASADTISYSLKFIRQLNVLGSPKLHNLHRFRRVPGIIAGRLLKLLNPVYLGAGIQTGNVQTFRTENYLLSSVQRYRPGEFGGREHLWHARLRGGINVFGNHPRPKRAKSPANTWVGNGINPDIAQQGNIVMVLADLRCRSGFLEGRRADYVHFFFPFVQFDQTRLGSNWVAGRKGNGYLGIVGTHHFEQISEHEIIQRGLFTGYAIIAGDDEEFGSLTEFIDHLRSYQLVLSGQTLRMRTPFADFSLTWKGKFTYGDREIGSDYDRYNCAASRAPRQPRRILVDAAGHKLELDWASPSRHCT